MTRASRRGTAEPALQVPPQSRALIGTSGRHRGCLAGNHGTPDRPDLRASADECSAVRGRDERLGVRADADSASQSVTGPLCQGPVGDRRLGACWPEPARVSGKGIVGLWWRGRRAGTGRRPAARSRLCSNFLRLRLRQVRSGAAPCSGDQGDEVLASRKEDLPTTRRSCWSGTVMPRTGVSRRRGHEGRAVGRCQAPDPGVRYGLRFCGPGRGA